MEIGKLIFRKFIHVYKLTKFYIFRSPSHSGYSFAPYANQSPACGPQRPYNPYNSQREHAHPVGYFRPTHPSPYTLPFCQQKHRPDTNLFVTPNAGMAENQKLCKSDEHLLKRRRLDEFEDFSSQGEAITISVKTQSTVCTINWSLSSRFSKGILILEWNNDVI